MNCYYSIFYVLGLFLACAYEDRQRGRFAGFSLYMSNSGDIQGSTLCYKDGPQLPPLNFTVPCAESGRYVIFYNERLDGATYPTGYTLDNIFTELCEVIVQGCNNASFYGSNCDTSCPTNCKDKMYHIQSGACSTYKPGWTDIHCNKKCADGWYGLNCSHQCVGHCRDGTYCNHVTGHCDTGCDAGSIGSMCDIECEDGTYGSECVNNCSGHCLDNSPCNKQTGHYDRGCKPGYTNGDCSKECSPGHFGLDCSEHCSGHCKNNEPCDHVNGVCPSGCQDGYIEKRCDDNVANFMVSYSASNNLPLIVGGTVGVGGNSPTRRTILLTLSFACDPRLLQSRGSIQKVPQIIKS